jgi:hypothetical protein
MVIIHFHSRGRNHRGLGLIFICLRWILLIVIFLIASIIVIFFIVIIPLLWPCPGFGPGVPNGKAQACTQTHQCEQSPSGHGCYSLAMVERCLGRL